MYSASKVSGYLATTPLLISQAARAFLITCSKEPFVSIRNKEQRIGIAMRSITHEDLKANGTQ